MDPLPPWPFPKKKTLKLLNACDITFWLNKKNIPTFICQHFQLRLMVRTSNMNTIGVKQGY